ncbi:MAG: 50S ribosomal protein L10 [Candidatus Omnitrophica bacterium]|nr:50S ribosomal protein L10 [Candidatus Omnitrophota bacterium]
MKVGEIFRKQLVGAIKDGVEKNQNTFLVSYSGVSAAQMNILRKDLSKKSAKMKVTKSKIARIALKDQPLAPAAADVNNQVAFVHTDSDAAEISKILVKFSKECKGFAVQGGLLDGAFLPKEDVTRLSDLPSREVLIAKLLSLMQSPATKLANILNAKSRDLLSILKQYSEKKGGS